MAEGGESYFSRLPIEIVEKIISYLSPYGDFYDAKLVCRLWYRLILSICKQRMQNFNEAVRSGNLRLRTVTTRSRIWPLPRFSHGCCVIGTKMYVYGGCSSTNTAFNDLYLLDLKEGRWMRPRTSGSPPPPKECATVVVYDNKDIVIFGGWCQPARLGVHSVAKFFDDLYIFNVPTLTWRSPHINPDEPRPCKRAGHGACVLGHRMILFGGAQRQLRFNDVWVLDLTDMTWSCPNIRGKKPSGRFGHSQLAMNDQTLLILGGCGGPNLLFGDVWILDTIHWIWQELEVNNRQWEAPQLWCHPAVRINHTVVVFSAPRNQGHALSPQGTGSRTGLDGLSPMQTYILDCSQIHSHFSCSWKSPPDNSGSPPATSLHSVVIARGEIIIFGGVFTRYHEHAQNISSNLVVISSRF